MADAARPQAPPERPSAERLDSWKEIAAYLRRGERTVRRWEQTEGLPVYRHSHQKQATVYAFRSELDHWLETRGNHREEANGVASVPAATEKKERRWIPSAVFLVAGLTLGASAWIFSGVSLRPRQSVTITPLTSFAGKENFPSFSPNAKQVAFSWAREEGGDHDIYTLELGSRNLNRLTQDSGNDIGPAWSPDGRWIAFLRLMPGKKADVMMVPAVGGPVRRVTAVAAPNLMAPEYGGWLAWSPDNKWLTVVDKPSPPEKPGLFLVSPDSGEKRRFTANGLGDFAPAFSPDGGSLAFVRCRAWTASDIFVLPLTDGYQPAGPPKQITFDGRFVTSPAWSRDGRGITFCSGELWGFRKVYQVEFSRSGEHQGRQTPLPIDFDEGSIFASSFALSGKAGRLVYSRPLFDPNIWMVNLDGPDGKPQPARKIISSTRADFLPQFSPDGKQIAFASSRSGYQEIWLSNRDGTQLKQLTSFGGKPSGTPRWSPDGRWIAFDSTHENRGIYVISAAGGVPRRITQGGVIPSWSRDGRWIYFVGHQVMKVAVAPPFTVQQHPVPVTPEGANAAFESVDGKSLYYSHRGSIWRMPTEGGQGQQVVTRLNAWSDFAVVGQGIFFIAKADPGKRQSLRLYKFSTGEISTVANLEKPMFVGLTASADGRSILYSQVDRDESDLMLVDLP